MASLLLDDRISVILQSVYFPTYKCPSEKGSTLKGNDSLPTLLLKSGLS